MRIAVNTRLLIGDHLEGVALYTHEILKRMVAEHPEDDFFFFFDRPFDQKYIYESNVTGIYFSPPARHPVLWWWWFDIMIPKYLKKQKIDIFLSCDIFNSLRCPIPSVLVVHDLAFLYYGEYIPKLVNAYYRYNIPRSIRKAEQVICVSEATSLDVQKNYQIATDKLSIGYNGVRSEFHPLKEQVIGQIRQRYSEGFAYFLFVGAIHPRKNVIQMIRAFDRYKMQTKSPMKFVIVGRKAWHNDQMEKAYEQARFKKDILFTGYLNLNELAKVTAAAFALMYLSLFEGFGVPLLEAMHCEIPIIASNRSAIPEVVGDAGIIVDPESMDDIIAAMQLLEDNASERERLISNARVQRQKFDWGVTAEHIYDKIKSSYKG